MNLSLTEKKNGLEILFIKKIHNASLLESKLMIYYML